MAIQFKYPMSAHLGTTKQVSTFTQPRFADILLASFQQTTSFNDHQTGDEGEMGGTGECHRW